jgi:stress response protein YsnF
MISLLTELSDYELVNPKQDVRGWEVRGAQDNRIVGTVRDLVVDTDRERVASVLLEDGRQIPTGQIAIRDHYVEVSGEPIATANTAREAVVPIAEERIAITKRPVAKGGVRVASRVEETPVEREVDLRSEHVSVERRPADRPAPGGTFPAQTTSTEVTAKAEQPVVDKEARVVEEVVVTKETRKRDATVRDNVRRTDVRVEPLGRGGR